MPGNFLADGKIPPVKAVPNDPDAALDQASAALVQHHGNIDMAAVRRAALAEPLDARPYLIFGHQQLLSHQLNRALATFEIGQRLDPRQGLIHVFLLDRYLRIGRYTDAALQMSVVARLFGSTQSPVATALASMALAPQTREGVRRTLRTDPVLEESVLTTLAKAGTPPATLFSFASPVALANAGKADSWGPPLVDHLVAQHRYAAARGVWRRIYNVSDAAAKSLIFDAAFSAVPAISPFNWALTQGSLGAADMKGGGLAIDYYGRDSGDLAAQLLVLPPGAYRFGVTVDPGKTDANSRLFWELTCVGADKPIITLPVIAGPATRHLTTNLVVPSGCPAQQLVLRGEAGDLPVPISVILRSPEILARSES